MRKGSAWQMEELMQSLGDLGNEEGAVEGTPRKSVEAEHDSRLGERGGGREVELNLLG